MIKIAFTGDIMLSRRVGDAIKLNSKNEWGLLSFNIHKKLEEFDFVVGNLECPIVINSSPLQKTSFKAEPESLDHLSVFDLFTLANNHIFDCGKNGANETLNFLKQKGFYSCGLYEEHNDNYSIFTTKLKEKTIGFIAAAVNECVKNESEIEPFVMRSEEPEFLKLIEQESKQVDYLFVLIHGGNEMISFPQPSFRSSCKKIIDAGARAVITHHPHVLGGFEIYNNKPIIYSLGDFIFDGQSHKRRRGGILEMTIIENDIDFKIIPTVIQEDLSVNIADNLTSNKIINKWLKVSEILKSQNYIQKYRKIYFLEMLTFQFDRIYFIIRNEGVISAINFIFSKIFLLKYYALQIIKNKIK